MTGKKVVVKPQGYAMDAVQKSFHAVTFSLYSYGLYFDLYKVVIPPTSTSYRMTFLIPGGRWKYLVYITLSLQCAFFGLCVLNDLIGSETINPPKRSFLQKLRDGLLSTLVVPLGAYVPILFWVLFTLDSELIFPAFMNSWFPGWLNHIRNTLPFFTSIIEIIVTNHVYPKGSVLYFPIVVAAGLYIIWRVHTIGQWSTDKHISSVHTSGQCQTDKHCYHIPFQYRSWEGKLQARRRHQKLYGIAHHMRNLMYPAHEVLDLKNRALFMASMVPFNLIFVYLGHRLHLAVWDPVKESTRRRKKKVTLKN